MMVRSTTRSEDNYSFQYLKLKEQYGYLFQVVCCAIAIGFFVLVTLFLPHPTWASGGNEVETAVTAAKELFTKLGGLVTAAFAVCLAPVGGMLVFKFLNKLTSNV